MMNAVVKTGLLRSTSLFTFCCGFFNWNLPAAKVTVAEPVGYNTARDLPERSHRDIQS
jgi:hypothetical protein